MINKPYIHTQIHSFAADVSLLHASFSLKNKNKEINLDHSNLIQWFRANKISHSVSKTEIVTFKSQIQ